MKRKGALHSLHPCWKSRSDASKGNVLCYSPIELIYESAILWQYLIIFIKQLILQYPVPIREW